YCLRLRDEGYRVVYEPGVLVHHFEFASATPDGAADLTRRNQRRFREKHAGRLAGHLDPDVANALRARSARRESPNVLVIDDRYPHRDLGSGFPRANRILREMVDAGCQLTVYATNQLPEPWDDVYLDIPRTVECLRGDRAGEMEALLVHRSGGFDAIFVS